MELARRVEGELAGCPGCGGQPLIVEGPAGHRSECPPCLVRLWHRPSRTEAISDWEGLPRVRVTESEPTERRDAA